MSGKLQAVGIIRVSQVNGREGEAFHSPETQRERIEAVCYEHGWRLIDTFEELDVSGAKPLDQRPGLRQAVAAVEARRASVVVAAYLDRLTRDPSVRDEVLDRVESAGGEVWTADMGRTTNGTAAEQLTGTLASAVARYVRRTGAERAALAQERAVERGAWMSPHVPPGYAKGDDGRLIPDAKTAPIVAEVFRMRAEGATIEDLRLRLREHGIERTGRAIGFFLQSRTVLGELHFGDLHNPSAHPAIVDRATWGRVQRVTVPRGRKPKSERLLARLGVLRCGSCGARMSVSSSNRKKYPSYRCGQHESCDKRQTISATIAEQAVVEYVREALDGMTGLADTRAGLDAGAHEVERTERSYRAAVDALDPTEPAEVERLAEFRRARDDAREAYEAVRSDLAATSVAVSAGSDWDVLALTEQRDLIRAVVERVEVRHGRGPDRLTIVAK